MQVIYLLDDTSIEWDGCVLTIGVFDGVHIGHRFVLESLNREAAESNLPSVVLTFDHHPQLFFAKDPSFRLLNTPEEKLSLLSTTSINALIIASFKKLSSLTYQDFIDNYLEKMLKVKTLLLGHNQKIGKNGYGTTEQVINYCIQKGINVKVLDKLSNDVHISSSEIRKSLLNGKVLSANSLLGYNYSFEAIVVEGKKLGKRLGFPTANLQPLDPLKIMPAPGVYAVKVHYKNNNYFGMMNYGYRPTIEHSQELLAEIHLFDFNGHLYNQKIKVELIDKIRNEIEFPSLEALKQQLEFDKIASLSIFKNLRD